jgi:hypothetical protein
MPGSFFSRWRVRLTGDERTFLDLQNEYDNSDFVRFYRSKENQWFIESPLFDQLTKHSEVTDKASLLARFVRSARKAAHKKPCDFEVQSVAQELKDDGTLLKWHASFSGTISVRAFSSASINGKPVGTQSRHNMLDNSSDFLKLALTDERVARVFKFLDRPNDYGELYKVLEVIEEDRWAGLERYKAKLKELEYTGNNHEAGGEAARHGRKQKVSPNIKPMPLHTATELTCNIVKEWLNDKLDES